MEAVSSTLDAFRSPFSTLSAFRAHDSGRFILYWGTIFFPNETGTFGRTAMADFFLVALAFEVVVEGELFAL